MQIKASPKLLYSETDLREIIHFYFVHVILPFVLVTLQNSLITFFVMLINLPNCNLIFASGGIWCPKIYFNHRCFSGPYLSKGRIAELPKSVGPGPVTLVMKEVLSMLINVAYKSSRVLRELQMDGDPDPSLHQQVLKAKYVLLLSSHGSDGGDDEDITNLRWVLEILQED